MVQPHPITPDHFAKVSTAWVGVWGHKEVSGLLTTVLRGLPSGAALILEVGDKEKFESRTDGRRSRNPARGWSEQLLDGQQRLTALWRSLNDKYADRTYLIGFDDDPVDTQYKVALHLWLGSLEQERQALPCLD